MSKFNLEIADEVSVEMVGSREDLLEGLVTVMVNDPDIKQLIYLSVAAVLQHEEDEVLSENLVRVAASIISPDEEA